MRRLARRCGAGQDGTGALWPSSMMFTVLPKKLGTGATATFCACQYACTAAREHESRTRRLMDAAQDCNGQAPSLPHTASTNKPASTHAISLHAAARSLSLIRLHGAVDSQRTGASLHWREQSCSGLSAAKRHLPQLVCSIVAPYLLLVFWRLLGLVSGCTPAHAGELGTLRGSDRGQAQRVA